MPLWLQASITAASAQFWARRASQMRDGLAAGSAHGKVRLHLAEQADHRRCRSWRFLPIILMACRCAAAHPRTGLVRRPQDDAPARAATTALTFSNAMRTFYSFVYRPTVVTAREQAPEQTDAVFHPPAGVRARRRADLRSPSVRAARTAGCGRCGSPTADPIRTSEYLSVAHRRVAPGHPPRHSVLSMTGCILHAGVSALAVQGASRLPGPQ